MFSRLHQHLVERGTVQKQLNEVGNIVYDLGLEGEVFDSVRNDTGVSRRQFAREVGLSHWKVLEILNFT